jgi:hypothetical protein
MRNKMKIYAVSEAWEAPSAYFSTQEKAEAYVAECARYWAAIDAFHASDAEEFDGSSFSDRCYPMGELIIHDEEVR